MKRTKRCWSCSVEKSTLEFPADCTGTDGLSGRCGECNRKHGNAQCKELTQAAHSVGMTRPFLKSLPASKRASIVADYRASLSAREFLAEPSSPVPTKRTRAKEQHEDTASITAKRMEVKSLNQAIRDEQWLDRPFTDLDVGDLYYFTIEGIEGRSNFGKSTAEAGGAADRIFSHQSSHVLFPDMPPRNQYVVSVSNVHLAEVWMFEQLETMGYTRALWHDSRRPSEVFLNVPHAVAVMVMDQAARKWPV